MKYQAIQSLHDGPIDIVGDVHGEITALNALIGKLGYTQDGRHPHGRRLVFVGDLVDRGEDSPAMVERVAGLVQAGRAQCVLGNHELNLLLSLRKEGNGWFYEDDHDHEDGHFLDVPKADERQRRHALEWFGTLPLALERPDLRVVHACWHQPAVDALRNETRSIAEVYADWTQRVEAGFETSDLLRERDAELHAWGQAIKDPAQRVPMLPALAAIDARKQTDHPIKALTSGLERPTPEPFYGGGKWRMTERVAWWQEYRDAPAVIFGHYWRWAGDESHAAARSRGPNLFAGRGPWDWLGPNVNTICVDYCAGLRWCERKAGIMQHEGLMAAVRWPEREVVTA